MRESMVFYRSFRDALKKLDAETYKQVSEAIYDYALDGIEPSLDGIADIVFTLIKPQIDANNKRAENGKLGADYGKLGGRPRKNPIGDIDKNPIGVTSKTPNVNVNANVNANTNRQKSKFNQFPQSNIDYEAMRKKAFKN